MKFERVPNQGDIIACLQYPLPGDAHLWVVLVKWEVQAPGLETVTYEHYATWVCNTQVWGYSHGHYQSSDVSYRNRVLGTKEFLERCLAIPVIVNSLGEVESVDDNLGKFYKRAV